MPSLTMSLPPGGDVRHAPKLDVNPYAEYVCPVDVVLDDAVDRDLGAPWIGQSVQEVARQLCREESDDTLRANHGNRIWIEPPRFVPQLQLIARR